MKMVKEGINFEFEKREVERSIDSLKEVNKEKIDFEKESYYEARSNQFYDGLIDIFEDDSFLDKDLSHSSAYGYDPSTPYKIIKGRILPNVGFREGTVCYFPFEEGGGNFVRNYVSDKNHCFVKNGIYEEGKDGKGIRLTEDSYIQIGHFEKPIFLERGGFSITFWIYPRTYLNGKIIASGTQGDPMTSRFIVDIFDSRIKACFECRQSNDFVSASLLRLAPEKWYHLAIVYDGWRINQFVNGRPEYYLAGKRDFSENDKIEYSFNVSNGPRNFDVIIDDLAIFDRALDNEEVYKIYDISTPIYPVFPKIILTKKINFDFFPEKILLFSKANDDVRYHISRDNRNWFEIFPKKVFSFPKWAPKGKDVSIKIFFYSLSSFLDGLAIFARDNEKT